MSEATNKPTAVSKPKRAKAVAKSATEQATKAEQDSAPVEEQKVTASEPDDAQVNAEQSESTDSLTQEEPEPLEQSNATKVSSQKEGDENVGTNQESTLADGVPSGVGDGTDGDSNAKDNTANDSSVTSSSVDVSNSNKLGEEFSGALEVTAKSDTGFWRSGVKFHRLETTLVLVLGEDEKEPDDVEVVGYESARVVCLSATKAKRIHSEAQLNVTPLDLDTLTIK